MASGPAEAAEAGQDQRSDPASNPPVKTRSHARIPREHVGIACGKAAGSQGAWLAGTRPEKRLRGGHAPDRPKKSGLGMTQRLHFLLNG